jgi:hypothetical protein
MRSQNAARGGNPTLLKFGRRTENQFAREWDSCVAANRLRVIMQVIMPLAMPCRARRSAVRELACVAVPFALIATRNLTPSRNG